MNFMLPPTAHMSTFVLGVRHWSIS